MQHVFWIAPSKMADFPKWRTSSYSKFQNCLRVMLCDIDDIFLFRMISKGTVYTELQFIYNIIKYSRWPPSNDLKHDSVSTASLNYAGRAQSGTMVQQSWLNTNWHNSGLLLPKMAAISKWRLLVTEHHIFRYNLLGIRCRCAIFCIQDTEVIVLMSGRSQVCNVDETGFDLHKSKMATLPKQHVYKNVTML